MALGLMIGNKAMLCPGTMYKALRLQISDKAARLAKMPASRSKRSAGSSPQGLSSPALCCEMSEPQLEGVRQLTEMCRHYRERIRLFLSRREFFRATSHQPQAVADTDVQLRA